MANINRNIRYYQPNDPYYWEVDNLPLTDLLGNDVVLEQRINSLEEVLGGLGGGGTTGGTGGSTDNKGLVSLDAISDLKAWAAPLSGTATDYGRVFVRPGKFISRMPMPATRESGWRMMRDKSKFFTNEDWLLPGTGMLDTTTLSPFVRGSQGTDRTAVVEFYAQVDGTDKSIAIESFNVDDFNGGQAPNERLDLIYLKGTKALDTDGDTPTTPAGFLQSQVPSTEIGVIKGAYFRTDDAGGVRTNGARFLNPISKVQGRTTGMGLADIPPNTNLPGFGTVPMPDDLNNFTLHANSDTVNTTLQSASQAATDQVDTQAAFTLPIAYVRVPSNYTAGDPLPAESIIDIRPFLRTAELTLTERQAISQSRDPHGGNPFLTLNHMLVTYHTPLADKVNINSNAIASNAGNISINTSRIVPLEENVSALQLSVSGTGTAVTTESLNHEGRITSLESSVGAGGPQILVERHRFLAQPIEVFSTVVSQLGSSTSPANWIISGIPQNDINNMVALQFRVVSEGGGDDTDSINRVYMSGGVQNFRKIAVWGVAQSDGDLRRNDGMVNTFMGDSSLILITNGTSRREISTYATGSSDVQHTLYVDGYIVQENA
jgi:hypothetical protein